MVRRIFARYGKILSFKLIEDPKFTTSIAFLSYKLPSQAKLAMDNCHNESEFE